MHVHSQGLVYQTLVHALFHLILHFWMVGYFLWPNSSLTFSRISDTDDLNAIITFYIEKFCWWPPNLKYCQSYPSMFGRKSDGHIHLLAADQFQ